MSRVASDSPAVVPARPHVPRARSASEDARQPSTPFADLLDTPAAEPAPAPRQTRSDRADKANGADKPKPADANTEAKPAKDDAAAKDTKAADGAGDTQPAKDATDGKTLDASKDSKGADAAADATDKPKSEADQSTALTALLADPATPPVTVPQAAVIAVAQPLALAGAAPATDGAPEGDALTALQATGQGVAPSTAAKPGEAKPQTQPQAQTQAQAQAQPQAQAQTQPQAQVPAQAPVQAQPQVQAEAPAKPQAQSAGDKHADADTDVKDTTPTDPQTAVPQADSGKDAQARGNGDKSGGELRHAAAGLLAKPGSDAPAQQGNDAGPGQATADAVQNAGALTPSNTAQAAAAPVAANAPAQTPAVAIPLSSLAIEITAQAHAGKSHFEIRLDPPELGRIDVKLNVDRDGNISTHVIADRSDTLDLLKRDASTLERALQQAGLKTSDNALEFSLRQQTFTQDDTGAQNAARVVLSEDDPVPLEAMRQGYGRLLGLGGGLDIRV